MADEAVCCLAAGSQPQSDRLLQSRRVAWVDEASLAGLVDAKCCQSSTSSVMSGVTASQRSMGSDPEAGVQELQELTEQLLRERDALQRRQALLERHFCTGHDLENQPPAIIATERNVGGLSHTVGAQPVPRVRRSAPEILPRATDGQCSGVAMLVAGAQIEFSKPRRVRMCKSRLKELDPSFAADEHKPPHCNPRHEPRPASAERSFSFADKEDAAACRIHSYPAIEKALASRSRRGDEGALPHTALPSQARACPAVLRTDRAIDDDNAGANESRSYAADGGRESREDEVYGVDGLSCSGAVGEPGDGGGDVRGQDGDGGDVRGQDVGEKAWLMIGEKKQRQQHGEDARLAAGMRAERALQKIEKSLIERKRDLLLTHSHTYPRRWRRLRGAARGCGYGCPRAGRGVGGGCKPRLGSGEGSAGGGWR